MLRTRHLRHAFTLIEMMAVVTIFALLAAFVAPQIGNITGRALGSRAHDVGTQIQLARERAILTGAPHRVLFDLESQGYRLEWWATEREALGEDAEEPEAVVLVPGAQPLELSAPREAERDWQPLAGRLGNFAWLEEGIRVAGIERSGDWIETGDVGIAFEWDGTTNPAVVQLQDEDGRRFEVDVLPLADAVRVTRVDE